MWHPFRAGFPCQEYRGSVSCPGIEPFFVRVLPVAAPRRLESSSNEIPVTMNSNYRIRTALILALLICTVSTASALKIMSDNPYLGAIVVDAATGKVLFDDGADAPGYPASLVKLMVLLVILDAVDSHDLTLSESVKVTAEASRMGGSQVYLKEGEVFSVDELLYALMVKSANDAAAALAIHHAGSKEAFVKLMNERALDIGMKTTVFHSVHGLPPGRRQFPDISTPRDIATLCRVLLQNPNVLKYTSTRKRLFRTDAEEPFIMRNHNPLLKKMRGCDGLKTGFFYAAGFSIAATASMSGKRAIAVVIGAENPDVRDVKAKEILSDGLSELVASVPASDPAPAPKHPQDRGERN